MRGLYAFPAVYDYIGIMVSVALIGLSLSMDAFAVSVSSGICIPGLRPLQAVRASLSFGLFQFIMPLAGWFLGSTFAAYIDAFDHWIAFGLLALIGGKMFFEALAAKPEPCDPCGEIPAPEYAPAPPANFPAAHPAKLPAEHPTKFPAEHPTKFPADIRNPLTLFNLSVATSIDALAVGISFSILGQGIWLNAALIGGITFLVCLTGFEFGRRMGGLFKKGAQIAGGLILIAIGLKILLEHLGLFH
jgi:putative Mn2+ efflux pump MntP